MAIEAGYCMVCGAKTHTECGTCGVKKFTDQHTEVETTWSNGSKMKVGVCVNCAKANAHDTPEAKQKITQAHQDHWEEQNAMFDKSVKLV